MKRHGLRVFAGLSAVLAIAAGAFGAHAAHGSAVEWLRTGGMYQLVSAIGAVAILPLHRRAALLMLVGASIFSASLYALALGAPRWFGAITPIGGVAMILAWLWFALSRR